MGTILDLGKCPNQKTHDSESASISPFLDGCVNKYIGATIRISQEIVCLPYAGFFLFNQYWLQSVNIGISKILSWCTTCKKNSWIKPRFKLHKRNWVQKRFFLNFQTYVVRAGWGWRFPLWWSQSSRGLLKKSQHDIGRNWNKKK